MTSPDDETDDLQAAGTLDAVWLLLLGGGRRESTPAAAELVLLRWHASQRAGAGTTVRLLLTDRRWSRCSHRLIAAVEHSGELDDDGLDELAVDLLQPGPLLVTVPGYLFAGGPVAILSETDDADAEQVEAGDAVDAGPLTVDRPVWPPLRRWSSARALARGLADARQLAELRDQLTAREAAAAYTGVLDSLSFLPEGEQAVALERGRAWPAPAVRRRAEQLLTLPEDAPRQSLF